MLLIDADPLVPVAFAPDQETAERYAGVLERAGIEAHVRIEDGAFLSPGGSAYGYTTSGQPFVYPVLVSRVQRRSARRALAGAAGGLEGTAISARQIAGAAAVVFGSMALVIYLAWVRGTF